MQKKLPDAVQNFLIALQAMKQRSHPGTNSALQALAEIGQQYLDQGEPAEAERILSDTLQRYNQRRDAVDESIADVQQIPGLSYLIQKKFVLAIETLGAARRSILDKVGMASIVAVQIDQNLGAAYFQNGDFDAAKDCFVRSLEESQKRCFDTKREGKTHDTVLCSHYFEVGNFGTGITLQNFSEWAVNCRQQRCLFHSQGMEYFGIWFKTAGAYVNQVEKSYCTKSPILGQCKRLSMQHGFRVRLYCNSATFCTLSVSEGSGRQSGTSCMGCA